MKLYILANTTVPVADWGAYTRKLINSLPANQDVTNWKQFHKHIQIADGGNRYLLQKQLDLFKSLGPDYTSYGYAVEEPSDTPSITQPLAVIGIILPPQVYLLTDDLRQDQFHNFILDKEINGQQQLTTIANGMTTSVKQISANDIKLIQPLIPIFRRM